MIKFLLRDGKKLNGAAMTDYKKITTVIIFAMHSLVQSAECPQNLIKHLTTNERNELKHKVDKAVSLLGKGNDKKVLADLQRQADAIKKQDVLAKKESPYVWVIEYTPSTIQLLVDSVSTLKNINFAQQKNRSQYPQSAQVVQKFIDFIKKNKDGGFMVYQEPATYLNFCKEAYIKPALSDNKTTYIVGAGVAKTPSIFMTLD